MDTAVYFDNGRSLQSFNIKIDFGSRILKLLYSETSIFVKDNITKLVICVESVLNMTKLTRVSRDDRKLTGQLIPALVIVLAGVILVSYLFQVSYAQTTSLTSPTLKTFRIEAQLKKSVIARGDTQEAQIAVVDAKTRQPVGGTITRATVVYPAGTPVRQFSVLTDSSGHSSISWQIEDNAPQGSYKVTFDIFQQGYVEESFVTNFSVTAHNVDSHHHHHHHNNN